MIKKSLVTGDFFYFRSMQNPNNSFELFSKLKPDAFYERISRPVLIADNLRTPENMGSVLRLAANIGAIKTLFISETAQEFKSYKIKKTASGAFDKTDWKIISPEELPDEIPENYRLIAIETTPSAKNIYSFSFPEKVALCIGNEKNGINPEILKRTNQHVYIPLPGPITSLNTTHALSIALFEWYRQMSVKIS